jgi:hypothetical protein
MQTIVADAKRYRLDTEELRSRLGEMGPRGVRALEVLG